MNGFIIYLSPRSVLVIKIELNLGFIFTQKNSFTKWFFYIKL